MCACSSLCLSSGGQNLIINKVSSSSAERKKRKKCGEELESGWKPPKLKFAKITQLYHNSDEKESEFGITFYFFSQWGTPPETTTF